MEPTGWGSPRRHSRGLNPSSVPGSPRGVDPGTPTKIRAAALASDEGLGGECPPTSIATTAVISYNDQGELASVNQYEIRDMLGKGSYGTVHRAVVADGTEYAAKSISKKKLRRAGGLGRPGALRAANDGLRSLRSELDILRRVKHRNIVELIEVVDDPTSDLVFIIFELLGQPVMDMTGEAGPACPLPEPTARVYFEQLVRATEYLHASGVIHRDIKPSNLLLRSEGWVKLIDFGVSTTFRGTDDRLSKTAGTPAFLAPESVDPDTRYFHGRPLDVWACGVTLFCLVFGTLPFQHASERELYTRIRDDPVVIPHSASPALRAVLGRLLDKNPLTRVTLAELATDPWVVGLPDDGTVARHSVRVPDNTPSSSEKDAPRTPLPARSVLGERDANWDNSPVETVLGPNGAIKLTAPRLGGVKGSGPLVGQPIPRAHRSLTAALHPWKHPSVRTPRPGAAFAQLRRRLRKNEANGQVVHESFV